KKPAFCDCSTTGHLALLTDAVVPACDFLQQLHHHLAVQFALILAVFGKHRLKEIGLRDCSTRRRNVRTYQEAVLCRSGNMSHATGGMGGGLGFELDDRAGATASRVDKYGVQKNEAAGRKVTVAPNMTPGQGTGGANQRMTANVEGKCGTTTTAGGTNDG